MRYNETLKFLYSLENRGMNFGLDRTLKLLEYLGNPQNYFKSIHIAGTNGKGSTTAFISSILIENGFKVGIYTSPHLIKFNERIKINNSTIPNSFLIKSTEKMLPIIKKIKPTFFELTTAICFEYFKKNKVDFSVIETGLGGRLDSTNVINPIISIITKIDYDHTEILGESLKEISFEKSGIIKQNTPVVIAKNRRIVKNEISKIAKNKNSEIIFSENYKVNKKIIPLKGKYQIDNVKNAIAAIKFLNQKNIISINDKIISGGIKNVIKNTNLKARFEKINSTPNIICDVAHNPDAIKNLIFQIKKDKYKSIKIIFGVMKDKNYNLMLRDLFKISNEIYFVEPEIDRTLKFANLKLKSKKIIYLNEKISKTVSLILKNLTKTETLIVTGSHYVVGEFLKIYKKKT